MNKIMEWVFLIGSVVYSVLTFYSFTQTDMDSTAFAAMMIACLAMSYVCGRKHDDEGSSRHD